jgi:hypothetical protein
MRRNRTSLIVVTIALLASVGAIAQDLRPDSLNAYGGTYSPSCSDAAAARVPIAASGLVIGSGSKQVRTPARMDSATSFGGAPTSPVPEGYRIEFIGDDFSLYVFEDAKGLHVPLDGYTPAAEAVVGRAGMKTRFGRCNAK